jgi:hypothetical protein
MKTMKSKESKFDLNLRSIALKDDAPLFVHSVISSMFSLKVAVGRSGYSGESDHSIRPLVNMKINQQAIDAIKPNLPYCLRSCIRDGVRFSILLNREYKPIGLSPWDYNSHCRVDYAKFTHLHVGIEDPSISVMDGLESLIYSQSSSCGEFSDYYFIKRDGSWPAYHWKMSDAEFVFDLLHKFIAPHLLS